jgi:hypothetical protein
LSEANGERLLSSLKWPIETIFTGLKPAYNTSAANPNQYRDWHRFSLLTDNVIENVAVAQSKYGLAAEAYSAHRSAVSRQATERLVYAVSTPTVETLAIRAQSVPIYNAFKSRFFQDYVPLNYGGENIATPEDSGSCMINFCFFPGTYQPSGHINVSRTREFYLDYTSNYCGAATQCDLVVEATAINFLLITDGNAILRYTT